MMGRGSILLALSGWAISACAAAADIAYPDRPVRMLIPYPAGGGLVACAGVTTASNAVRLRMT